jgi:hypothetical protein
MSFRSGNDIIIDATDSSTTDITSEVIDCTNLYGIAIHAISTGTIAGTVQLQVSNDKENWVTISAADISISNATNDLVEKSDLFAKWARIFYDATSGTTNTLKVHITTKGI